MKNRLKFRRPQQIAAILILVGIFMITSCNGDSSSNADNDNGNENGIDNGNDSKKPGAAVETPTLNVSTYSSISINAVTAPDNGQVVEYAINTIDSAPASGWQNDLFFAGLNGDTVHYIFARSRENSGFYTGEPGESLEVVTKDIPVETILDISQMLNVPEIINAIEAELISNDIITIEGEFTNGSNTLDVNIHEYKKLIWKAVYSGNANILIMLSGKGSFEIAENSEITAINGTAIVSLSNEMIITVDGGRISANGEESYAVSNHGNVIIAGGEISANGQKVRTIWSEGIVTVSGDAKVSALGDNSIAVRARGGVDVNSGEITAEGKYCYAIRSPFDDVNIFGGSILAIGDNCAAISTDNKRNRLVVITVSNGSVTATGENCYAIHMSIIDILVHTNGEINGEIYKAE